ncbi:MAG: tRNA uridine-5-carboxymethylaminomethyl(34) synthesis GTPase MnmE [Myxococcales bacterium]|nr:tRNA uridine-5-carboxymethylaminomethyl(34) synthesis GTPase MnmE [Myxococcales bacterium]
MRPSRVTLASDTICAIASSAAVGGVGVIRISGPRSLEVLRRVAPFMGECPEPSRLSYGRFRDGQGSVIDDGYAVYLPGPRTFTGDDVAEVHGHGGAVNLARLLRAFQAAGARTAERGEFSLRAFRNGRLDLAQAEAIADLVEAPTEAALELARAQYDGELSRIVRAVRAALTDVLAAVEVQIDFVDEDLGDALTARVVAPLRDSLARLVALKSTWARGRLMRIAARIVLTGPPNAGKSSLFNVLLDRSRAIVSARPGTTRDFLEDALDLGGYPVTLIDTAGLRDETDDDIESAGMLRAIELAQSADAVLWLHREGEPPPLALCRHPGLIRVWTQLDRQPAFASMPWDGDVRISVVTGEGLDALRTLLFERVVPAGSREGGTAIVTSERHHAALDAACVAVSDAIAADERRLPPELIAIDVKEALDQLGLIVGDTTTEDVLDRIFSRFCIGK